jgi:hypothetical protein
MAWKKQDWIPGGADICTFRRLILDAVRSTRSAGENYRLLHQR